MTLDDHHKRPNFEREIERARQAVGAPFSPPAQNLAQTFALQAARFPDKDFLVYYDDDRGIQRRWSWHDAYQRVAETAGFLASAGVQSGDRVAYLMGNLDHTLLLYIATWTLGASVAPINASEDADRKSFIAENSGAKLLFAREDYGEEAKELAEKHGLRRILVRHENTAPSKSGDDIYPDVLNPSVRVEPKSADFDGQGCEALLIYTSGTTGAPKGVRIDQKNILADNAGMAEWHGWDDGLKAMCVLPVHHVNGIVVTLCTPIYVGGTVVLNSRFNSRTFWQRVADEHVQIVSVVPTLLEFLSNAQARPDATPFSEIQTSSLETILCGAGPLLVETVMRFERQFGIRITHGYGLSETTCYNCHMPPDLDQASRHAWYQNHSFPSIGVPLPYQDMGILSADGQELTPGERGEIAVRGECISLGYDRRPDANEESFRDGWFRSGDEGFFLLDDQGRKFFFITGRLKELIIRGGVNYSPLEIDEVLNTHPCVEVGLCVPFANRFYGEEIAAYVVLKEGQEADAESILTHCFEKLEFSKSPKVVIFGTDIPYTTTGKPQRLELSRKLAEALASHKDTQFRAK